MKAVEKIERQGKKDEKENIYSHGLSVFHLCIVISIVNK